MGIINKFVLDELGTVYSKSRLPSQTLKILHRYIAVATAVFVKDSSTDADYVVTTGKTFYALALHYDNSVSNTLDFYQGDTAAATTLKKFTGVVYQIGNGQLPLNFSIASAKYVTAQMSTGGSMIVIVGYEE